MNTPHAQPGLPDAAAAGADLSLEACDEAEDATEHRHYCPVELLADFALLMAGHGRCVSTDMMLGDREYAMWQVACARAMEDPELERVATRLFAYFDDPQHQATPMLGMA